MNSPLFAAWTNKYILMKNKLLTCLIPLLTLFICATKVDAQQWAVNTNGLYWLTGTPNIGFEYGFHKNMSVALNGNYNPFTFKDNAKMKHWLVQGEYRYWLSETFKGHFFGIHAMTGSYNFGNLPFGSMKDYRYEGSLYGGGFSYGYQWIVSNRVNIGADIGLGYWSMDYNKFYCQTCGERIDHYRSNYFGPTKIAVSIIYLLK